MCGVIYECPLIFKERIDSQKQSNLLGASQSTQLVFPGMSDLRVLIACKSIMLVLDPPLALELSLP